MTPTTSELVLPGIAFFIAVLIISAIVWSVVTVMGRNDPPPKDPSNLEAGLAVPNMSMIEGSPLELQDSVEKRPYLKLLLRPMKGILQVPRKQLVPLLSAMRTVDPMSQMSIATSDNLLSNIRAECSVDHLELFRRQESTFHAITIELDIGAELWPSLTSGIGLELLSGDTDNLTTSGIVQPPLEVTNADLVKDDDTAEDQRMKMSSSIAAPGLSVLQSSTTTLPTLIFTSPSFNSTPIYDRNSKKHSLIPPSHTLTILSMDCGLDSVVTDCVDKAEDMAGVDNELMLCSDDSLDEEYSLLDDASIRLLDDFPSPPQPHSSWILSPAFARQAEPTVKDVDALQRKMSHRKKVPSLLETNGLRDEDIMETTRNYTDFYECFTAFRRQSKEYNVLDFDKLRSPAS